MLELVNEAPLVLDWVSEPDALEPGGGICDGAPAGLGMNTGSAEQIGTRGLAPDWYGDTHW